MHNKPDAQLPEPVESRWVSVRSTCSPSGSRRRDATARRRVPAGHTVGPGRERDEVERGQPNADPEVGSGGAYPVDDLVGASRAVGRAIRRSGPADRGREQFVQQVAVAVLHVDEVEPGVGRQHRGVDEALRQRVELVVVEQADVVGPDAGVQHGWRVDDPRRRRTERPAPAARVRELQADDEVIGAAVGVRGARRPGWPAARRTARRCGARARVGAGWRGRPGRPPPLRHPRSAWRR